MLRNETVDLNVTMGDWIDAWGATCEVQLTNKAGHKFPSGYPARRAWIEVKASQNGEVIWHSGGWENGSITGVDESGLAEYEPHHTVINDPMQVQIYELVAADVEGNPTNVWNVPLPRSRTTASRRRASATPTRCTTRHASKAWRWTMRFRSRTRPAHRDVRNGRRRGIRPGGHGGDRMVPSDAASLGRAHVRV